jgi:hypothetical protein
LIPGWLRQKSGRCFVNRCKIQLQKIFFKKLIQTKRQAMPEQGKNYPTWFSDKLHIETMLSNRVGHEGKHAFTP